MMSTFFPIHGVYFADTCWA